MLESVPSVIAGDTEPCGATRLSAVGGTGGTTFRLPGADPCATPPAEVLDGLDGAQSAQEELDRRGLTVSFDVGADGGLSVSVLDERGAVVHTFSPAEALDALSGEAPIGALGA
jgi:hypothetical protein